MFLYTHTVQYYETDRMGVTHHSNYIRWMEEARIALLDSIGLGYEKLEPAGVVSPVASVSCEYKRPTTFKDVVEIAVRAKSYNGVKLNVAYEMRKAGEDSPVLIGASSHVFLNHKGAFLRMKRDFPELDRALCELVERKE